MKVASPYRELKPFKQDEACFMVVNNGAFSVRTPNEFISFNKSRVLLAKCFNFFIETTKEQREQSNEIEFIGVFLFPDQVEAPYGLQN